MTLYLASNHVSTKFSKAKDMDLALAIALPIASASFLFFSLLSIAYFFILHKNKNQDDGSTDLGNADNVIHRFKSSDIDALVSSFNSSFVVGEGGFSTVYIATYNYSLVAVKVQNSSQHLHRAFHQELSILLSINPHPNIVRLVGYCDENERGVLVFDYVPNGTLHDFLHKPSLSVLQWPHRVFILFHVALALEHLHDCCQLQVIHGDVKSSNVLLDGRLDPKLCDFGSGRMGFSATVTKSANQMMGSLGYADPHYLRTGLVSKKSDVYSFGVLVMESVSGVEAFDPVKERLLTTMMRGVRGGRVEEFVDRRLGDGYNGCEVETMMVIAWRCVAETPLLRPTMGEIVKMMMENVCIIEPKVGNKV